MKQTLALSILAFMLIFSGFFPSPHSKAVYANEELEGKIEEIEGQREENQAEAEKTEEEIEEVKENITEVEIEIRELDEGIVEANQKVEEKKASIEATSNRIDELNEEINKLQVRIEERDDILKERVRAMYQNGGSVNYLEVLLGAQGFGDLLDRITALTTIADQDRSILEAHKEDHDQLEAAQSEVEGQLSSLESQLEELERLMVELENKRGEKDELINNLEDEEIELLEQLEGIENEEEVLARQKAAAEQELAEWQRQEELREKREEEERAEREEAERKREEEQTRQSEQEQQERSENAVAASASAAEANTEASAEESEDGSSSEEESSGNNAESSASASETSAAPADSGTRLHNPATGRRTSEYGPRWGRMHHGLDIGQGGRSNVPIMAAESGTVIEARYMNGYGNTIMITHNVNGQTLTTLYAHLDSIGVSSGERVSRGQQIGIMGNTGRSTGPHLHFEVHEAAGTAPSLIRLTQENILIKKSMVEGAKRLPSSMLFYDSISIN